MLQPHQSHCTTGCGRVAVNGSCFPPLAFKSTSTWNSKTKNHLNWPSTVYIGDKETVFELPSAANLRDEVRREKFSGHNEDNPTCQDQESTSFMQRATNESMSCTDLAEAGYCNHDDHGDKVKQECLSSCGICDTSDPYDIDPDNLRYKLFWTHHAFVNVGSTTTTTTTTTLTSPTATTRKEATVMVYVGASTDNPKWIDSEGVFRCDDEPTNECCGDTFEIQTNDNGAKIDVGRIKVKRMDVDDGWGQSLIIQCYRWVEDEDARTIAVNFTADYVGMMPPHGLDGNGEGTDSDPGGTNIATLSGTITSTPLKAGTYTAWLLLEDGTDQTTRLAEYRLPLKAPVEWNQLVVAQHTFNVVEKPPFEIVHFERRGAAVAAATDGATADDAYITATNLTDTLDLIAGDVTRIAPIDLETFTTSGREGRPITFTLAGAPEGIFVVATTGAIVATPREASGNVVVVGLNAKNT